MVQLYSYRHPQRRKVICADIPVRYPYYPRSIISSAALTAGYLHRVFYSQSCRVMMCGIQRRWNSAVMLREAVSSLGVMSVGIAPYRLKDRQRSRFWCCRVNSCSNFPQLKAGSVLSVLLQDISQSYCSLKLTNTADISRVVSWVLLVVRPGNNSQHHVYLKPVPAMSYESFQVLKNHRELPRA